MEQISKNFSMAEFGVTGTGLTNVIPESVKPAIRSLTVFLLQPICDATGWRCWVNSGYRCLAVNKAVGGAATSQHVAGEAADCTFYNAGAAEPPITVVRELVKLGLDFDQAILYPNFVHLSYTAKRPNRRQILYNSSYKGPRL